MVRSLGLNGESSRVVRIDVEYAAWPEYTVIP